MEWFASTLQFIMHSAHDLNKCVLIWQLPLASPTNQTVSVCITSFSNMHSSGTIWSLTLDPDESMCSGWVRFDERTSSRGKGDGSFPSIYVYQGDYEEVMVILLVKWTWVAFCLSIYFHLHLSTFSFQFYFPSILTPFHFPLSQFLHSLFNYQVQWLALMFLYSSPPYFPHHPRPIDRSSPFLSE